MWKTCKQLDYDAVAVITSETPASAGQNVCVGGLCTLPRARALDREVTENVHCWRNFNKKLILLQIK